MPRTSHPKQEIEEALRYAELHGWRVEVGGSHAWGKIYCPYNDKECCCGAFCIASIWSTQKMRVIMPNKSNEWLITVALEKSQMTRNSHARI